MPVRLSIVIPSRNQARFLAQTLDSVLSQRGDFALECIVMDGASTDGSVDVIRAAAARASAGTFDFHWTSAADGGQADAIRRGLERATGDVLAYLNSDDLYSEGALAAVASAFAMHPDAMWLTGDCAVIDENGREIQRYVRAYRRMWQRHYSRAALLAVNFIAQPATFWTREAMQRAGAFDDTLDFTMDYDYWLRLSSLRAPLIIDRELASFRIHGASKGGSRFREQFAEDYRTACRHGAGTFARTFHRVHNAAIVTAYRVLK